MTFIVIVLQCITRFRGIPSVGGGKRKSTIKTLRVHHTQKHVDADIKTVKKIKIKTMKK